MKKRTVILVLAMVLSLSVVGCGNNAEPKQEVKEQETKQEEQKQEETKTDTETADLEDENIVLYAEKGQQDYCPLDESEYTTTEEIITAKEDIPIYNEKGYAVGYIKTGATINVTETGTELAWTRFKNPIAGTDYDYLYVLKDYLDSEQQQEETVVEEPEQEEISPQDEILLSVGYDKDKTYTEDEYIEILTKVLEEMGKKYNEDVEKGFIDYTSNKTTFDGYHVMMSYYSIDFSNPEDTLQNTKNAMSYVEGGLDGASNITEFAIGKGQKDGEETINIYVKVAH